MRLATLATLALLIAQLGAVAHAYSHDAAFGAVASQRAGGAGVHDACNDCLSYATVLSAAGAPSAPAWIEPQGRTLATRATARSLIDRQITLAFRSRAPPVAR